MNCPDEDSIAAFTQGLLDKARAQVIEAHVDRCARCSELLWGLAALYGSHASQTAASPRGPITPITGPLGSAETHAAIARRESPESRRKLAVPPFRSADSRSEKAPGAEFEIALATLQLLGTASMAVILLLAPPADALHGEARVLASVGAFTSVWIVYVFAWALLGVPILAVAYWAKRHGYRWAGRVVQLYSLLSLPTGFAAPLAVLQLIASRRG